MVRQAARPELTRAEDGADAFRASLDHCGVRGIGSHDTSPVVVDREGYRIRDGGKDVGQAGEPALNP